MVRHRESNDPPGPDIEHTVQKQLAHVGIDFGAIAEPLLIDRLGGEVAFDQVSGPPAAPPGTSRTTPATLASGPQPLLGHDLGDGVDADLPSLLTQISGDPG